MNKSAEKEKKVWYKNTTVYLWIGGTFFIAAIVVPQWIYFCHFHGAFAEKADAWGQYGDFIGGITNPVLSAISIGVLVVLTITVNNNEKKRHEDELQAQKKMSINQFRHDAYKQLREYFDSFNNSVPNSFKDFSITYSKMSDFVEHFDQYNRYLFKNDISYTESIANLKNLALEVKTMTNEFSKNHRLLDDMQTRWTTGENIEEIDAQFYTLLKKNREGRGELIELIQTKILNQGN